MMSSVVPVALLVLLVLGVPVAVAIGLASAIGLFGFTPLPGIVIPQQIYVALDRFPLAAIPFFILSGKIMEVSGLSRQLVEFARALVGGVQGGLAAACVLTSMMFAAISGSSVATTFAVGSVVIPALVRYGYPVGFAAALMATAAELGVIIPPSIPMILFGVATETSIPKLFLAGFGPGFLIAAALVVTVLVWSRLRGWGRNDGDDCLKIGVAFRHSFFALLMPVIVLGGIYGGVTTPTEASVIAVVYSFGFGLVSGQIGKRAVHEVFKHSVLSSSAIMMIIATASLLSYLLDRQGMTAAAAGWIAATFDTSAAVLLASNLFLFVTGMFVETSASVLVLGPILTDAARNVGVDPVHFGTVMVVNVALGMITPPFGVNLFSAAAVAGCSVHKMMRPLGVFILVILACLALITYVPAISLTLVQVFS